MNSATGRPLPACRHRAIVVMTRMGALGCLHDVTILLYLYIYIYIYTYIHIHIYIERETNLYLILLITQPIQNSNIFYQISTCC